MKVGLTAQWGTQEREGGALELCRQLRTSPSEGRAHRAVGYSPRSGVHRREGGALVHRREREGLWSCVAN